MMDVLMKALEEFVDAKVAVALWNRTAAPADFMQQRVDNARKQLDQIIMTLIIRNRA